MKAAIAALAAMMMPAGAYADDQKALDACIASWGKRAPFAKGTPAIRLSNPQGWYCFRSNVAVAGALNIEAPCEAQIATATEEGTSVGAVDESNKGVAVFGALRVKRYGCPAGKGG